MSIYDILMNDGRRQGIRPALAGADMPSLTEGCAIRHWLDDGIVELGIGTGFLGTALVLQQTVGDIAADGHQVAAYAGQFLLAVLVISLSLPITVTAIRRRLPADVVIPHRFGPIEPFRRQMLIILLGLPILVSLGWLTADMARLSVAELGRPLLLAVALITSLIPLGFAIVTGWGRFFIMVLLVVAAGPAAGLLFGWLAAQSLFAFGLLIWAFAGMLFLATGGYNYLRFRHYLKQIGKRDTDGTDDTDIKRKNP